MSEFDREMRRRLWCVLYLWDFALGAMLSRPSLVSRADCTFELPTLALEIDPGQPYQPSPFRHMKLHCQMCIDLAAIMASQSKKDSGIDTAQRSRLALEKWFRDLPGEYAVKAPDTRWDGEHEWVVFQRRYLHLVGYMSLFALLKQYVAIDSAEPISELESDLREAGVQAALDLMDMSYIFFENLVSVGAKFHYAVFCIFDTATLMCSAFVRDAAHSLPQREVALPAIKKGLTMLETLRSVSKTTSDLCRMLKDLLVSLPLSAREKGLIGAPKRAKPSSPALGVKELKAPMRSTNRSVSAESNQTDASRSTLSENDDPLIATPAGTDEGAVESSMTSDLDNTFATPDVSGSLVGFSHQIGFSPSTRGALANVSPISIPSTAEQLQPVAMVSPQNLGPPNDHSQSSSLLDGYSPPSDLMLPNSQPLHDFHFPNLQPSPLDADRLAQVVWQTSEDAARSMSANMFQEPNVITLNTNMPTVLEYWDWESLQLGNPNYWGGSNPPPM
ncbi:hypothetical protein B0T25DRAFT_342673 [Lasiosphaeria hispida]|uniref:Transcription factor domain-containing protein n=1 Tax=Lasiosphaeria hispida TaxID=260671 RepID=A0AAJ0H6A4_9PEZI|nr:hypothetical protein B0T25DRAFT_342673 [Lasiosphaeria hispida]